MPDERISQRRYATAAVVVISSCAKGICKYKAKYSFMKAPQRGGDDYVIYLRNKIELNMK